MRSGRERAQRNLYVLNLPLDATTDQLEALFAQFGQVEHAVILATLDHLARRRGFILMSDSTQARAAIANLNGHDWHGYRVEVSFAIVQRSATPFSQECVESHGDEVAAQPKAVDTVVQPVPGSFQDDLSSSVPARDQLTADSRAGSAPPSVRSNIVSQAHSTPRPSQIPTGHVALSPARIGTDHGGASHHSLWSENGATVAAASKQDSEDSDHGPRRNVPRPIGDERQRATGKKWK
ncbi:RNA recognition motif domain protein [Kalmanozyma brasiliensis GHG001]|uniref:RNA recognition motif domain protein n=1 Tax=Kalmanozyma brasiliensis (strain GHG001) TaxID=1365824 RepID=UPI002867C563|nr:RNA recognition motif domain protein [Kalmanozyma brasiliensis GHG001]EST09874.2 RNA recognition motif domain protein [Kalmanozyma brasiliensis GHG001]